MRKLLVSALLITVVGLADASKGGGGEKKKDTNHFKTDFTPIRTTNSFTLRRKRPRPWQLRLEKIP